MCSASLGLPPTTLLRDKLDDTLRVKPVARQGLAVLQEGFLPLNLQLLLVRREAERLGDCLLERGDGRRYAAGKRDRLHAPA